MLTSRAMIVLAQSILVIGSLSLTAASVRLFLKAIDLGLSAWWLLLIVPLGALAGWAKARFVMRKRMVENVRRLRAATGKLWPWHIYPPQLLVFIVTMVILLKILKRVLAQSAPGMATLGGVDITVAVALLVASSVYRSRQAAAPPAAEHVNA